MLKFILLSFLMEDVTTVCFRCKTFKS